jgi:hypothetical protein
MDYQTATDKELTMLLKLSYRLAMNAIRKNQPVPLDVANAIRSIEKEQQARLQRHIENYNICQKAVAKGE